MISAFASALVTSCAAWLRAHATSTDTAQVIRTLEAFAKQPAAVQGATSFVWRPGAPSPSNNVFSTWVALAAALAAVDGAKVVAVDTLLAPAVVTAGSFTVTRTTFEPLGPQFGGVRVQLADGAELVNLAGIDRGVQLEGQTSGPAQLRWTDFGTSGPSSFVVGLASSIVSASGFPLVRVGAGQFVVIAALEGGAIGDGLQPVVSVDDPTGQFIAGLAEFGALNTNAVQGVAGSALTVQYCDSSVLPDALPGFLGLTTYAPQADIPQALVYVNANNGSDTQGNGSSRRPYRTLARALATLGDTNTIRLSPGNYAAATLPTLPPRGHLTLEGLGSDEQDSSGVVIRGFGVPALTLAPGASEASNIRALTLRNLKLIGDPAALSVANGGAFANAFMLEGLKLQNCRLSGLLSVDLQRVGGFFAESCIFEGGISSNQTGRGRLVNCKCTTGLALSYDSSATPPAGGRQAFELQNTQLDADITLGGNPWLSVDKVSSAANVMDLGLVDVGGQGVSVEFAGKAFALFLNLPDQSIPGTPPLINLDDSKLVSVAIVLSVPTPGGPRFPVSATGCNWDPNLGGVVIGEQVDIDLKGSSYNRGNTVTAGAGPDKGTVDRSIDFEPGTLNAGPITLTLTNPFPPGAAYAVTVQQTTTVAGCAINNRLPESFEYEGLAGGGPCIFVISRL